MSKKKFATRFWLIEYVDLEGNQKSRLAQGPKHYRVSKVKRDLKWACPEMSIKSIKRIPRPDWSVIFEVRDAS